MMKNFLFIFLLIIPISSNAQKVQKLKLITKKNPSGQGIKSKYTVFKRNKHIKHGDYETYYTNGQIKEKGLFDNNKKNGKWEEYNFNGKIKRIREYERGKLKLDEKYGVWKEEGLNGKLQYYDYDKNERILPQIPIPVAYPRGAADAGITGIVKVKVVLDNNCEKVELKILKSLGLDFDKEAIKGLEIYIKNLKYFEDCVDFNEVIAIEFKID